MIETVTRTAVCPTHGEYEQNVMMVGSREVVTTCPHCEEEAKSLARANEEIKKVKEMNQKMMQAIGIPKRYENATLSNYEVSNEKQAKAKRYSEAYVNRFESVLDKGASMIFCGKVGTGKTHLAYAIAREVYQRYHEKLTPKLTAENSDKKRNKSIVKVASALDILRDVKSTYSSKTEKTELEMIENYASFELLIVDEVGVQFGSEAEKVILFEVFNRRYLAMKPTIMISNLALADLTNFVGDRVIDRLMENSGSVLDFDWESYRK